MKNASQILEFDASRVRPMPGQPRQRFKGIPELAASIAEVGQLDPGIVTLVEGDKEFDAQLIDGERRLRACREAGVPFRATVRSYCSNDEAFAISFAANFGRQDHDSVEIAEGLGRLRATGKSVEHICRITGKSNAWVYSHLNLLKLQPDVLAMVAPQDDDAPRLTFMLAQLLMPVSGAHQLRLARKIVRSGMSLVGARRLVLNHRRKSGDEPRKTKMGRQRRVETIQAMLEGVSDRIGVYLDMPGAELNSLIDAMDNRDKRLLIEGVEELSDDLISLAEAVEKRLPKTTRRSA